MPLTGETAPPSPAPARAEVQRRRPEEPAPGTAVGGPLRCLWYDAALADTLAAVDEFLRTRAGTAALADFCRAGRGGPAAALGARALVDTVGRTADRLRA